MHSFVCICLVIVVLCNGQLVINVRNRGGDVVQETLTANTTDESVSLEFQKPEGTLITQFIDFKAEVQVFRLLILGEEERGQSQYQVICFVTHIARNEFISPDAMSKLRQRNPGAIRQPEEELPTETSEMDVLLEVSRSSSISPFLPELCQEAQNSTYAREEDLRVWARGGVQDLMPLVSGSRHIPASSVRCSLSATYGQPCLCQLDVCVGWYPCGLKYCRGKDPNSGKATNYRCGIKTCRKCRSFQYAVTIKQQCLWDN